MAITKDYKAEIEKIKKDFYLMYGRFDSSTGKCIGMTPPETIEGLWSFFEDRFESLISTARREAVEGFITFLETNFPLEKYKVTLDIETMHTLKDLFLKTIESEGKDE